ncbi:MAG: hypothetical protein ACPGVO_15135 [Spirulinaceae cyanobacterium]
MALELIDASAKMLRSCLYSDPPFPFIQDSHYEVVYQRVLEIQAEQCDAIYSLYEVGLFRPAYAILRSILEGMATLLWVSLSIERYCKLFEESKQPNTKEILKRIGWEDEYDRTFRYLSGFVHIDMSNAEFYRNYEIGDDPSQPFPEILPDTDYYIVDTAIDTANDLRPLSIRLMSKEEAANEYGLYLAVKTFDIIAASLQKLYGVDYYKQDWWQQDAALACMKLSLENSDIAKCMLWSLQQSLF